MIRYDLICGNEHEFDAWFKDSASFDKQAKRGQIACPHCGETDVTKALMAPNVAKKGADPEKRAEEVARKILAAVGAVRAEVEENCEYVGDEFADEARRIHYGDAEERGIYGEATEEDVEMLDDEGIDVMRLPGRPKSKSN